MTSSLHIVSISTLTTVSPKNFRPKDLNIVHVHDFKCKQHVNNKYLYSSTISKKLEI